mmetsp:Transcript_26013/g.74767  ORF Transcript_26013/g.74767 Transcript_26013/m.74767 type:complete len:392 (+) Transcript_26013:1011-2186(+)
MLDLVTPFVDGVQEVRHVEVRLEVVSLYSEAALLPDLLLPDLQQAHHSSVPHLTWHILALDVLGHDVVKYLQPGRGRALPLVGRGQVDECQPPRDARVAVVGLPPLVQQHVEVGEPRIGQQDGPQADGRGRRYALPKVLADELQLRKLVRELAQLAVIDSNPGNGVAPRARSPAVWENGECLDVEYKSGDACQVAGCGADGVLDEMRVGDLVVEENQTAGRPQHVQLALVQEADVTRAEVEQALGHRFSVLVAYAYLLHGEEDALAVVEVGRGRPGPDVDLAGDVRLALLLGEWVDDADVDTLHGRTLADEPAGDDILAAIELLDLTTEQTTRRQHFDSAVLGQCPDVDDDGLRPRVDGQRGPPLLLRRRLDGPAGQGRTCVGGQVQRHQG